MKNFTKLLELDLNDVTEVKGSGNNALTYLSWAWAWARLIEVYPDATYEIVKNEDNLPYFADDSGAICYTKITIENLTHEMWLPVMNSNNRAMKSEPYTYLVKNKGTWNPALGRSVVEPGEPEFLEKSIEAYTMFDINKTVMRCLVKNMAMFGLGLYIFAGEDLPQESEESKMAALKEIQEKNDLILAKNKMNKILSGLGAKGFEKDDIVDLIADNLGSSLADCTDIEKIKKLEGEINRKTGEREAFDKDVYPEDQVSIEDVTEVKE